MLKTLLFLTIVIVQCLAVKDKLNEDAAIEPHSPAKQGHSEDVFRPRSDWSYFHPSWSLPSIPSVADFFKDDEKADEPSEIMKRITALEQRLKEMDEILKRQMSGEKLEGQIILGGLEDSINPNHEFTSRTSSVADNNQYGTNTNNALTTSDLPGDDLQTRLDSKVTAVESRKTSAESVLTTLTRINNFHASTEFSNHVSNMRVDILLEMLKILSNLNDIWHDKHKQFGRDDFSLDLSDKNDDKFDSNGVSELKNENLQSVSSAVERDETTGLDSDTINTGSSLTNDNATAMTNFHENEKNIGSLPPPKGGRATTLVFTSFRKLFEESISLDSDSVAGDHGYPDDRYTSGSKIDDTKILIKDQISAEIRPARNVSSAHSSDGMRKPEGTSVPTNKVELLPCKESPPKTTPDMAPEKINEQPQGETTNKKPEMPSDPAKPDKDEKKPEISSKPSTDNEPVKPTEVAHGENSEKDSLPAANAKMLNSPSVEDEAISEESIPRKKRV